MVRKMTIAVICVVMAFTLGCDKIGINKKSQEEDKNNNLIERIINNDQTASMLQKQMADLQTENSRLNAIISENDLNITALQGQLASSEAMTLNMQKDIKSSKKTKTILSVIAAISLIFNALFLWIIFGSKKHGSRLALPPARDESKKDIDIMKYSPTPPAAPKTADTKTQTNTDSIKKAQMASTKTTATTSASVGIKKTNIAKKPTTKKPVVKKPTAPKPDDSK